MSELERYEMSESESCGVAASIESTVQMEKFPPSVKYCNTPLDTAHTAAGEGFQRLVRNLLNPRT